jgi:hypothetical protein
MVRKLINYKKYLVDYEGEGKGGARKIVLFEEAFRKYSEEMQKWLQDIVVPRKDKTIQVEVLYGSPQISTALRAAPSQQEKPEVNREFGQKLVDLREDRTKIPIIGFYISAMTYDQSRELPGEIFYKGQYVDDSKKDIIMLNKEIPFVLQYTLSIWTKSKSDMFYIHQQLLNRFNPNIVFYIDKQEIPCRLDSIVDTSALEVRDGAYQLVRNDVVLTLDAWIKRNAASVRTVQRDKIAYHEMVVTDDGRVISGEQWLVTEAT